MTDVGRHINEGRMELSKSVLEQLVLIWKMKPDPTPCHIQKSIPYEDLNMKYTAINFKKKTELRIFMSLERGEIS